MDNIIFTCPYCGTNHENSNSLIQCIKNCEAKQMQATVTSDFDNLKLVVDAYNEEHKKCCEKYTMLGDAVSMFLQKHPNTRIRRINKNGFIELELITTSENPSNIFGR